MDMIQEIIALPVIVQGALGSALFATSTYFLKIIFSWVTNIFSTFNKEIKTESKTAELVSLYYDKSGRGTDSSVFLVWCIFHSLAHITQAAIWLVLGSLFAEVIHTFVYVGYAGALYYLYRATKMLPRNENNYTVKQLDTKIKELEEELEVNNT